MDTLTVFVDRELTVEERLRLKDRIADAYRWATETTAEIGVDHFHDRPRPALYSTSSRTENIELRTVISSGYGDYR